MKPRVFMIWMSLLSIVSSTTPGQAAPNHNKLSIEYSFEAPVLNENGGFTEATIPGCQELYRAGKPVLPFRTARVLLPPGRWITHLAARSLLPSVELEIAAPLPPAPAPVMNLVPSSPEEGFNTVPADSAIYDSEGPFPDDRVELASIQRMADYDIAIIRIFPLQYYPRDEKLVFVPHLEISMEVSTAAPGKSMQRPGRYSNRQTRRVTAFVDNPEMVASYQEALPRRLANEPESYDYLILTREVLATAFQPLADQKKSEGLSVLIETIENIESSQTGRDLPEKIRNYIRNAATTWGTTYVVLGGDTSTVPCRYAYAYVNQPDTISQIPCDLYYACLDGSWNRDNDNRWGEPTDGDDGGDVDLLAEVYVGRIPVDTEEEVAIFLDKNVRFQAHQKAPAGETLLIAEFLGDTPTGPAQGGRIFDPIAWAFAGYQLTFLDDRPYTHPQWTRSEAIEAMNRSPRLVLLNGHGNSDILIGGDTFQRSIETWDLDSLANEYPFFAYSVGCDVGQYDNDQFWPDCIGEEILKRNSFGAAAAVFNSRVGWYLPQNEAKYSGEFQEHFFESLLMTPAARIGVANQEAKSQMLGFVENSGLMTYRFCYYEITLFGDPHLEWNPPDTDNDGMVDAAEVFAGTDPADQTSALRLRIVADNGRENGIRLEWPSAPGRIYSIYRAAHPRGEFALIKENVSATPPLNTLEETASESITGFYQIGVRREP